MYDLDADQAGYKFQFYHIQPEILGKLFNAIELCFQCQLFRWVLWRRKESRKKEGEEIKKEYKQKVEVEERNEKSSI